jgi:hypothetical protein
VAPNASSTKNTAVKTTVDGSEKLSFSFTPGSKEVACLGYLLVGLLRALAERHYGISKINVAFRRGQDATQTFSLSWLPSNGTHLLYANARNLCADSWLDIGL